MIAAHHTPLSSNPRTVHLFVPHPKPRWFAHTRKSFMASAKWGTSEANVWNVTSRDLDNVVCCNASVLL